MWRRGRAVTAKRCTKKRAELAELFFLLNRFSTCFRRSRGHRRRGWVLKFPELPGCAGNSLFPLQNSPVVQFDTTPTQSTRHYKVTNHQRSFSTSTVLYLIYSIFIYDHNLSMTFRYLASQQALQLGDIANSTRASGKRGETPLAALSLARAYRARVARRLL